MQERGQLALYRTYFPNDEFKTLRYYWAGDYLVRAAVAGALVTSPESLHDGMFELSRKNATRFAESLIGRTLIRLLSPKPKRLMEQGIAARRQTISWGEWALVRSEPGHAEIRMRNEYMWIESFVAGAWVGSMQTLGVEATVKCQLESRFNGTAMIDWSPQGG
jgi:uncharacterized protein (TIGR02265 family)